MTLLYKAIARPILTAAAISEGAVRSTVNEGVVFRIVPSLAVNSCFNTTPVEPSVSLVSIAPKTVFNQWNLLFNTTLNKYQFYNNSGLFLSWKNNKEGAKVTSIFNSGDPSTLWTVDYNSGHIVSNGSGLAIEVDGQKVILAPTNPTDPRQELLFQ
jgi:hypothetical protein